MERVLSHPPKWDLSEREAKENGGRTNNSSPVSCNNDSSSHSSGASSSFNPDLSLEDELQYTFEALQKAQEDFRVTQKTLQKAVFRIRESERALHDNECSWLSMQDELHNTQGRLREREKQLEKMKRNRWRLLASLRTTRNLLAASLVHVRGLEGKFTSPKDNHHPPRQVVPSQQKTWQLKTTPLNTQETSARKECEADGASDCPEPLEELENFHEQQAKLCRQVVWLEKRLADSETSRQQERAQFGAELQELREDRARLALIEDRLVRAVRLIRTLADLNLSRRTLGRLVLEALDNSVNPSTSECSVLRFLNNLYHNALDYERINTESLIHLALQAV